MEQIKVNYEIPYNDDTKFKIMITFYDDIEITYKEKNYLTNNYKNINSCLYNDILNDFDLDNKDLGSFYDMLEILCNKIENKIKNKED